MPILPNQQCNMRMINIKKVISLKISRRIKLLGLIDSIAFIKQCIKTRKQNIDFLNKHKNFPVPPKRLSYDAYGHTNWQIYFDMGQDHARYIAKLIQENTTHNYLKICEWGCGPARILRHLREYITVKRLDLFGSDYNRKTINWCTQNIQNAKFLLNSLSPPLSFKENYLDCIYAISVFTHLSEAMHYRWIKELTRVTKNNGLIIITTQGDKFKNLLTSSEKEEYEAGKLVVRGNIKEGKKLFSTFHPTEFMNKLFSEVNLVPVKHITNPELLGFSQDIWILKKQPTPVGLGNSHAQKNH